MRDGVRSDEPQLFVEKSQVWISTEGERHMSTKVDRKSRETLCVSTGKSE